MCVLRRGQERVEKEQHHESDCGEEAIISRRARRPRRETGMSNGQEPRATLSRAPVAGKGLLANGVWATAAVFEPGLSRHTREQRTATTTGLPFTHP